jgi:aerobic carbon-monoxide dehydrogenase small subunit
VTDHGLADYDLTVNGRRHRITDAWEGESLLWVLRERLGLPGAKGACEQGECGTCSVLLDDQLVCSCLVLAAGAEGHDVVTVEGIAGGEVDEPVADERLSDVQRAFVDAGAVQCGFCTPGFVVAVHALLDSNPEPTELEVREAVSGNLCRCTGYGRIVDAISRVVAVRRSLRT